MLDFLDKFFLIFHTLLILFILFGWIFKKTRLMNMAVILITLFCWLFLGIWYGIGYCPCTDWHWQIRAKLGYYDMPSSYIKFLFDSLTGVNFPDRLVEISTGFFLLLAFLASLISNIPDWKKRKC